MHGHFRSRDKDGGHSIRFAIFKNPILHANLMAVSFREPDKVWKGVFFSSIGLAGMLLD